jgi:hypothetical protein
VLAEWSSLPQDSQCTGFYMGSTSPPMIHFDVKPGPCPPY